MDSLFLVTYKNKMLLYAKEKGFNFHDENVWRLLSKRRLKELNLETKHILLAPNLHHIILNDEKVNSITRGNGYRLEFYNISELKKLELSEESRSIITKYYDLIEEVLH